MSRRSSPFRPSLTTLEDRTVPYALSGYQWADTNVTASFMPDGTVTDIGTPSDLFAHLDAVAPTATWQREYARALQTWASVTPLNFRIVPDSGAPFGTTGTAQGDSRFGDIRLGGRVDGLPYIGYGYYPTGGSSTGGGDVFLSTAATFRVGSHPDLYSILLHETGHALGLEHSTATNSVMYPSTSGVFSGLTADDVAGIQAIYGVRRADAYDAASANDTLGSATAWSVGSTGAASLNADLTSLADVDYYKLAAPAAFDGTLRVSVIALNVSLLTPKVSVYDATGNLLGSASATSYAGVATVNLTGLAPGQTYYLAADGATDDVFGMGAYRLSALFGDATVPPTPPPPPAQPSVSIGNVSLTEGDAGTKQFNFTVALSAASTGTVTVQYDTADGTATAGGDYQAATGTLTFAPGETQKAVTVVVTGDTVAEGDETFRVNLSSPVNAALGTGQGVGTIRNDDTAPVVLSPDRYESNDTAASATNLGKVSSVNQGSLTLHTATDVDFYTFTVAKKGTYRLTITPSQGSGLLNLAAFNSQQTVLTSGQFQNGSVALTLTLNAGQPYYLKATSGTGSLLAYSLTVAKTGKGQTGGALTVGELLGGGLEVRPSLWQSPSFAAAGPSPSGPSDEYTAPASGDVVQFLVASDEQGSGPAAAVRAPTRETVSGSYTWQRGIDSLSRENGLWDLAGLRSV